MHCRATAIPPQPPKYVPKDPPQNPLFTGPTVPKHCTSSGRITGVGFSISLTGC